MPSRNPQPPSPHGHSSPEEPAAAELWEAELHRRCMDAMARMAGGVAHDFNNLLTAIQGYTELVLLRHGDDPPLRADLEEILAAARQGAELTRRLMAFSNRTPTHCETLDLSEVARSLGDRLRPLVGDAVGLELHLAPEVVSVEADRSQLEEAIICLVDRAREATSAGGTVALRTGVVELAPPSPPGAPPLPGRPYARLTLESTGGGLEPEARARLFDPTFSLKEPEMSASLRLAIALRALHQSDGFVTLASSPAPAVTMALHLPARSGPSASSPPPPGGSA